MNSTALERRMAENEAVFREYNERIQRGFVGLKQLAESEGRHDFIDHDDIPLHFYCECSDEDCTERIILPPSRYNKIHAARDKFVLIAGHETKKIEKIVEKHPTFYVVKKFIAPAKPKGGLNDTPLHNV